MRILLDPQETEVATAVEQEPVENKISTIDSPAVYHPDPDSDIRKPIAEDATTKVIDLNDFKAEKGEPKDEAKKVVEKTAKTSEESTLAKQTTTGDKGKPVVDEAVEEKVSEKPPVHSTEDKPALETKATDYGEVTTNLFKKMPKEAREFFAARLDDLGRIAKERDSLQQQLKTQVNGLPASYLEHPEAYTLDPKFKQATQNMHGLRSELDFWTNQLIAIRNGDKWNEPARDEKGNIVYTERQASPQADVSVSNKINQAQHLIAQNEGVIDNLSRNFKQGLDSMRGSIKQLEDQYFGEYTKDRKALADNKHFKVMSDLLETAGQKDNMLKDSFAMLYRFSMEREDYIKKLESEAKGKIKQAEKVITAGPNSGDLNAGGGTKKALRPDEQVVNLNAFALEKQ